MSHHGGQEQIPAVSVPTSAPSCSPRDPRPSPAEPEVMSRWPKVGTRREWVNLPWTSTPGRAMGAPASPAALCWDAPWRTDTGTGQPALERDGKTQPVLAPTAIPLQPQPLRPAVPPPGTRGRGLRAPRLRCQVPHRPNAWPRFAGPGPFVLQNPPANKQSPAAVRI